MASYPYPPSQNILAFGELQQESHFFADGYIQLNVNSDLKIDCSFEIGYTLNCHVICVCYINMKNEPDKQFRGIDSLSYVESITGIARYGNFKINIEDANSISQTNHSSSLHGQIRRIVYLCKRYTVFNSKMLQNLENENFHITNLEFATFQGEGRYELNPKSVLFQNNQTNNKGIELFSKCSRKNLDYSTQPTAVLNIPETAVVGDWCKEEIADLWCLLVSLAFGVDVKWTSSSLSRITEQGVVKKKTYVSRNIQEQFSFRGFSPRIFSLPIDYGRLPQFVDLVFDLVHQGKLNKNTFQLANTIYQNYKNYCTSKLNTLEGNARLVTTLTDEFVWRWQQLQDTEVMAVVNESEYKIIKNSLKSFLKDNLNSLLSLNDGSKRSKEITNEIMLRVRDIKRPSFKDKLQFFFSHYMVNTDVTHIQSLLSDFVIIRNRIVHAGEFPEDSKLKLADEKYFTPFKIIPLMLFSMFQYDGIYYENEKKRRWRIKNDQ